MNVFYPVNPPLERGILQCAMLDEQAALKVARLDPEMFGITKNRWVHEALKALVSDGAGTHLGMFREKLLENKHWEDDSEHGNRELICMADVFTILDERAACLPAEIGSYIRDLRKAYRQRRILESCQEIMGKCRERLMTGNELNELEQAFQEQAFSLATANRTDRGLEHISIVATNTLKEMERPKDKRFRPIKTGFRLLDAMTGGFFNDELTVICGRPGHGKTAFAVNIARHVAKTGQGPAAIFSLEMSAEQLTHRIFASETGINVRVLRSSNLHEGDYEVLYNRLGDISEYSLWISDTPNLSAGVIRTECRQMGIKTGTPPRLVIVDYLQLTNPSRYYGSREREVASISREMKLLSKELGCTVILLSQLNRKVEERTNKRPILSDLRESGAVEQDADRVIGLYQPHKYSQQDVDLHQAECIVMKQRNGETGTVYLHWEPTTTTYSDPLEKM